MRLILEWMRRGQIIDMPYMRGGAFITSVPWKLEGDQFGIRMISREVYYKRMLNMMP